MPIAAIPNRMLSARCLPDYRTDQLFKMPDDRVVGTGMDYLVLSGMEHLVLYSLDRFVGISPGLAN
jgi:hypothetical protein